MKIEYHGSKLLPKDNWLNLNWHKWMTSITIVAVLLIFSIVFFIEANINMNNQRTKYLQELSQEQQVVAANIKLYFTTPDLFYRELMNLPDEDYSAYLTVHAIDQRVLASRAGIVSIIAGVSAVVLGGVLFGLILFIVTYKWSDKI